jgi:hypothetical protein
MAGITSLYVGSRPTIISFEKFGNDIKWLTVISKSKYILGNCVITTKDASMNVQVNCVRNDFKVTFPTEYCVQTKINPAILVNGVLMHSISIKSVLLNNHRIPQLRDQQALLKMSLFIQAEQRL